MREFDVVVIGAGIAGTTAAMTAARFGYRVGVVERMGPGGQIINATHVENVPGLPQALSGIELGPLLHEQAESAGAEFILDTVESLAVDGAERSLTCAGDTLGARAVIVAAGSSLRDLGIPGETALAGRGVSHCASCDGPFFRGRRVCVIGGGDAAFDEALVLAEVATEVVVFHRAARPSAQRILVERAEQLANVGLVGNTVVEEILGDGAVAGVRVRDLTSGTVREETLAAAFVFVGLEPNSRFLADRVRCDAAGHIETDILMQTSLAGVFAAGDIRSKSVRLLAACAGDGATAAVSAHRYLQGAAS